MPSAMAPRMHANRAAGDRRRRDHVYEARLSTWLLAYISCFDDKASACFVNGRVAS